MAVTIKNLRSTRMTLQPYDVKIDRQSVLGNPFHMHMESQRDDVCDQYKKYHADQMTTDHPSGKAFQEEMHRLLELYKQHEQIRLFCWCVPKRCHGETIKAWLDEHSK